MACVQEALTARQVELQTELRDVQAQLTAAQGQVAEGAGHKDQLVASLATTEEALASLRREHADYRHKATSILQVGVWHVGVSCGG